MVDIHTYMNVKDIGSDIEGWDTLVPEDILKDIQEEVKGISSLVLSAVLSINVVLSHLM